MADGRTLPSPRPRIARSAALNLVGQAAPAVAALIAVRQMVNGLGVDRFGVLAIAWAAVGYAGLFDLGTGRALTRMLSSRGARSDEDTSRLVWTALAVMAALGLVTAVAVFAAAPQLAGVLARRTPTLLAEVTSAIRLMAVIVPVAILTSGMRGVLEAQHRFGLLNAILVPGTLATYLVPILLIGISPRLPLVILGLIAVRVALLAGLLGGCLAVIAAMRSPRLDPRHLVPLLTFGGWASVTNFISPLIVQTDRVLLAAVASLTALGYYALPAEVTARCAVVPGSLTQVLFPVFSESVVHDEARTARLLGTATKALFGVLYPATLLGVLFAPEALTAWLGSATSGHASATARLLAVAFFVNALAYPPFALIHAAGKPRLTACIHLLEFPAHVAVAWLLIRQFGPAGAAAATLLRNAVDTVAMLAVARRILPAFGVVLRRLAVLCTFAAVTFAVAASGAPFPARLGLSLAGMIALIWATWAWLLDRNERSWCRALAARVFTNQRSPAAS